MENNYGGMTVNERLHAAKQLDAFDEAIKNKDDVKLRQILTSIEVDEKSITTIIERYIYKQ